jgi:uncharacterized protein YkwD
MRPRSTVALLCAFLVSTLPMAHAEDEQCLRINAQNVEHVDVDGLRARWLEWMNGLRASQGLKPYALNEHLNATASNWSTFSVARGTIDHRRTPKAAYYDYGGIERWFSGKGLDFAKIGGKTFTENVGWGVYRCKSDDCTQSLTDATRSTFDFFLSERGSNGPHYRSLVSPQFTMVGIGVALSPAQGRYYLTLHYATDIVSEPAPLCSAT